MRLYRINENEFINLDEVVSIGIYNEETAVNNNDTQASKGTFTLSSEGYAPRGFVLRIIEG